MTAFHHSLLNACNLMEYCKLFFILVIFACSSHACFSQPVAKAFTDCSNTSFYEAYNGDTVFIRCDTVMFMNRNTFLSYKKSFDRLRSGNASIKDIIGNYENTIRIQTNMLTRQEGYYQTLKSKLDSMSNTSLSFIDKTSNSITAISASLNSATNQLVATQSLLHESQQLLIDERKRNFAQKLKIGIGSFGVGVGITALLFLLGHNN